MDGTLLVAGGAALLASYGLAESHLHRRRLAKIPYRIHVNGTRGKSGVTRLIAAGLRAGGIRTCAKTTGTLARMIMPDGSEHPVFRPGRANVIEQIRIVKAAVAHQAEALVIECMALQPHLQSLCELKLVKSTHGVMTNARADHLDVMGPTERDVALAMAATVPVGGKFFTAEQKHLDVFCSAAADRKTQVYAVDDEHIASISWDEMSRFAYIEHPDNVALALQVCADLGVDRFTALQGMWGAQPDPGVMTTHNVDDGQQLVFVNGFAANDPVSTGQNWNMLTSRFSDYGRHIAVFNCRADRPDRSVQLAEACLKWKPAHHYLAIGSATNIFAKRAEAMGLSRSCMTCVENGSTQRLIETVNRVSGASAMVMGMGNIAGPGMEMVRYFSERSAASAERIRIPQVISKPSTALQSRELVMEAA
jgi:poly-gamma-glutamate synthase PgsB/CapB